MVKLTINDRRQLRESLISGFRNYASLKIFVSDNFNFQLNQIAPSNATRDAAEALIEHFEEGGKDGNVWDLILALYQARPNNAEIQTLVNQLRGFLQQRLVIDPSATEGTDLPFDLPEPYSDTQLESFLHPSLSFETDVGQLRRGLQLADAVCKVSFTDRATTGTGVLIAPSLVLTNYHILSEPVIERSQLAEIAKTLSFEFGYVSEEHDTPVSSDTFAINATEPIIACSPTPQLDYVLLQLESRIKTSNYINPIPVHATTPLISEKEGLNILQHPQGDMMQVSLSASGIVKAQSSRGRVWYVNRTQGGSSGSPCFNNKWELIALHHASMSRGFGSVREGILLSSILSEVSGFLV